MAREEEREAAQSGRRTAGTRPAGVPFDQPVRSTPLQQAARAMHGPRGSLLERRHAVLLHIRKHVLQVRVVLEGLKHLRAHGWVGGGLGCRGGSWVAHAWGGGAGDLLHAPFASLHAKRGARFFSPPCMNAADKCMHASVQLERTWPASIASAMPGFLSTCCACSHAARAASGLVLRYSTTAAACSAGIPGGILMGIFVELNGRGRAGAPGVSGQG